MRFADFEFGQRTLKFWDENKVSLNEFKPEGSDKVIRYFRKLGYNNWDKEGKIISRSGLASFREPFEIEPWNQILIDEANVYGSAVDEDKGQYLRGFISGDDIMEETKMSLAKIVSQNWIWVARGQMVCHPDSLIYGEIDEIWYEQSTDTYYVGDTKTSSTVDKIGYWYQLGVYIEILKALNPDKKIAPIGSIDWTKIKTEKWVIDRTFNENDWKEWIGKTPTPNDDVYRAKWNSKQIIPVEKTNLLIKRDLQSDGVLELAKKDLDLIKKYSISSVEKFNELLQTNDDFVNENKENQLIYDKLLKLIYEK